MPIAKLQSASNLSELAQRLYALYAGDARIATAARALAAANPQLPADLSTLPPETPVIAPAVGGVAAAPGAQSAVPGDIRLLELVRLAGDAAKQIVTAAASGSAPAPDSTRAAMLQRFAAAQAALRVAPPAPKPVDQQKLAARLKILSDNVEAFLKLHGD